MNLHIEMILNLKTRQHRLKLHLRCFSEVLNLFLTVAHFHFENIPMGLYRKFLQTLKRSQKKSHRVRFRKFSLCFKRSQKIKTKNKRSYGVGIRDFSPLVRPSPMEKGHRIGMQIDYAQIKLF